ncbi:hypothetical protein Hanom_Chr04g00337671 [Helianthus anomalus]
MGKPLLSICGIPLQRILLWLHKGVSIIICRGPLILGAFNCKVRPSTNFTHIY